MTNQRVVALFHLEPAVCGGFGERTVIDRTSDSDIPNVQTLEYRFDDWTKDEIVSSFPCYLVSKRLYESLESAKVTGVAARPVLISRSTQFLATNGKVVLPEFLWLTPVGRVSAMPKSLIPQRAILEPKGWSGHDVCLGPRAELLLSKSALDALDLERLPSCRIRAFPCLETSGR